MNLNPSRIKEGNSLTEVLRKKKIVRLWTIALWIFLFFFWFKGLLKTIPI